MKKNVLPGPFTYPNPNEIYSKVVAKHEGSFSMPRSKRDINFTKYSSVHSILV